MTKVTQYQIYHTKYDPVDAMLFPSSITGMYITIFKCYSLPNLPHTMKSSRRDALLAFYLVNAHHNSQKSLTAKFATPNKKNPVDATLFWALSREYTTK